MARYVAGEPFVPVAKDFQAFANAADWVARNSGQLRGRPRSGFVASSALTIEAEADADFAPYSVVAVNWTEQPPVWRPDADEDTYPQRLTYYATTPTDEEDAVGVTVGPISSARLGQVVTWGVTWAKVNVTTASHEYCKPTVGQVYFTSSLAPTNYRLWSTQGETGNQWCPVFVNYPLTGSIPRMAVADEDLLPSVVAASGTVSIWQQGDPFGLADTGEDVEVWLDWVHGGEMISLGTKMYIDYFADGRWRPIAADCE